MNKIQLWLQPLDAIRALEDNNLCADCNTGNPTHCNVKYGVLLCGECASIHEDLCKGEKEVLSLDSVSSQKEVKSVLELGGNRKVNNRLEKFLPSSYKKSFAQLNLFIKRQYIKKKYINKGFELETHGKVLNESRKVGILSKKSTDGDNEWKLQYVVLDRERKVLECFKKSSVFDPENSIPLVSAEVFVEEVDGYEGGKYCLRVSWEKKTEKKKSSPGSDDLTEELGKKCNLVRRKNKEIKHIFLATGWEDELFEWYSSILTAQGSIPRSREVVQIPTPYPIRLEKCKSTPALNKLDKLDSKFPVLPATVGVSATPIFLKTGKLFKAGPDKLDSWKERWFTLHNNHIVYSRSQLAPQSSGEFRLGATLEGYRVEKGYKKHSWTPPHEYTFTIITPGRTFSLCAESAPERDEWVDLVNKVIHHNNSTIMLKARNFNVEAVERVQGLRKSNSADNVNV